MGERGKAEMFDGLADTIFCKQINGKQEEGEKIWQENFKMLCHLCH